MKKTLMIAVAGMIASSAFAQGLISINEASYKISSNGVLLTKTANSYFFDVIEYVGSGTPTINSAADLTSGANWIDTGVYGVNGSGVATQGYVTGSATASVTAGATGWSQDTTAGTSAYFVVVGWSSNLANGSAGAWASIVTQINGTWNNPAGVFAYSNIGNITANVAPGNGASVWQSGGATAFNLVTVAAAPEPGTMALAALGGASLLLFRRRNK